MISDEERQELKDMAASESLREEFRALRRNSDAIVRSISVDQLAHWLTVMARLGPTPQKSRWSVHHANMKI